MSGSLSIANCAILSVGKSCADMQRKKVFINDRLVGEASAWTEVFSLIKAQGLTSLSKLAAVEGPSAFYISGALVRRPLDSHRMTRGPARLC